MVKPNNIETNSSSKGKRKIFPPTSIGLAEEVLKAVKNAGNEIDTKALETALNTRGGALSRKIVSARRWHLVKGFGKIKISELGEKILHPLSEEELAKSRKKAFLNVELFGDLYNRFRMNPPTDKLFTAILIREYSLKEKDAKTIVGIYKDSIRKFLSLVKDDDSPKVKKNLEIDKDGPNNNENCIYIKIKTPLGTNILPAKNKEEFLKLKEDLEKYWSFVETFWREDNHIAETKEVQDETQKS